MKLSKWAQKEGISYSTAYRWYQNKQLPNNVEAYQSNSGTIIIKEKEDNMLEHALVPYLKNGLNKTPLDMMFKDMLNLMNEFSIPSLEVDKNFGRFKTLNEDNEYIIVGEIPGFSNDDIKITVKNNLITISGKHEVTEEENKYFSQNSAVFNFSFNLPYNIDENEIIAEHENGILKIKIPKTEGQNARQIAIKNKPK